MLFTFNYWSASVRFYEEIKVPGVSERNVIFTLVTFASINWNNFPEIYDSYFCKDKLKLESPNLHSSALFTHMKILQPANVANVNPTYSLTGEPVQKPIWNSI